MLSTGLRRPTSRRFPACSGPVPLSRSQSFPTPVSRVSKSPTSRLRSFEHSLLLHATTAHAFRLRSLAQIMCRSPEALALGAAVIHAGAAITAPNAGALLTGLATAVASVPAGISCPASLSLPLRRLRSLLPRYASAPAGETHTLACARSAGSGVR